MFPNTFLRLQFQKNDCFKEPEIQNITILDQSFFVIRKKKINLAKKSFWIYNFSSCEKKNLDLCLRGSPKKKKLGPCKTQPSCQKNSSLVCSIFFGGRQIPEVWRHRSEGPCFFGFASVRVFCIGTKTRKKTNLAVNRNLENRNPSNTQWKITSRTRPKT